MPDREHRELVSAKINPTDFTLAIVFAYSNDRVLPVVEFPGFEKSLQKSTVRILFPETLRELCFGGYLFFP
jgi:hypothetical protein